MNIFTLTILFPLLSFVVLSISQGKWSENISSIVGISGVGISALITTYLVVNFYFYESDYTTFIFLQELWPWFKIDNLHITISFRLDGLSLLMLSVITGVGLIIQVYSIWYMSGSEGYARFFSYTNLFISNMILLVLSDDLLLMYFGWEVVGLCSYLLIGFYYFNSKNGLKAFKAFIITRFGDICLICALFMIYDQYHTLNLSKLLQLDPLFLLNSMSTWISVMLLIGALAKSAQLPLQTWLISAMAGPTPVSGLIHSATMVTAGVYLIVRMHNFFLITPFILNVVGWIGSVTLILCGCSAIFQSNIKKILAYSTISQIGYMFLALGGKNWIGAVFHLTTHAFFKALLFLSAGSLIRACQNEQNIFKMGGLYRSIPIIYVCFLIGGASLSGLPIITAGFYSKELILFNIFITDKNHFLLFLGLIGVLLTPIYIFRMIFVIFHGKQLIIPQAEHHICQYVPLFILSLLSTFIGGQIQFFIKDLISMTITHHDSQIYLVMTSTILVLFGIWLASYFWINSIPSLESRTIILDSSLKKEKIIRYLILLCHYGWGLDWLYKIIFIKPYLFITKKLFIYKDPIGLIITNIFMLLNWLGRNVMCIENSKLNWYVASINIGVVIILLIIFMSI